MYNKYNFLFTKEEFLNFKELIYLKTGIVFSENNKIVLENRIKNKLNEYKLSSPSEYYKIILYNNNELNEFLDSVTTNLTRFFRNSSHINILKNYVLPDLLEHKKEEFDRKIKVWSAGCSTGEEPYSISMILDKMNIDYSIIASDISYKSLLIAQKGNYKEDKIKEIPDQYKNYLNLNNDEKFYNINERIKKKIAFDYHNLKNKSQLCYNMDIVFCVNVLIYFDSKSKTEVINNFYETMNNYSYLFIGHSETLINLNTKFKMINTEWGFIYKKYT